MFHDPIFQKHVLWTGHITRVYDAMGNSDLSEVVLVALDLMKENDVAPQESKISKSENESDSLRKEGNKLFGHEKYQNALFLYNRALQQAPKESKALTLAYSNRSAVFQKIGMFQECIDDINRCFSMDCPSEIKSKLEKRKEEVSKLLKRKKISTIDYLELKSVHSTIPCASSCLDVDVLHNKVTAATDIKVGTVLAIEKAYVSSENIPHSTQSCHYCQRFSLCLLPCDSCGDVFFCSDKCKDHCMAEYHKIECEIIQYLSWDLKPIERLMIISSIKLVLNSTWDELIDISNRSDHSLGKFGILNLKLDRPFIYGQMFNASFLCATIIDLFEALPSFFPQTTRLRNMAIRALARIMMSLILYSKLHTILRIVKVNGKDKLSLDYYELPSFGLYPFIDRIKRSCENNAITAFINDKLVVIALKPIKRGMEILIPNLTHIDGVDEKCKRDLWSFINNGDICACKICTATDLQVPTLTKVQKRKFVQLKLVSNKQTVNPKMFENICDTLTVLSNVPQSVEYKYVYRMFIQCLISLQYDEQYKY